MEGCDEVAVASGNGVGGIIVSVGREAGLVVGTTVTVISHARDTTMKREKNKRAFFIATSPFRLHHSYPG
jgi:hypothetical protein